MPLEVTLMIASFGCSILGSGTSSTRTSRFPCQVTAFKASCPSLAVNAPSVEAPREPRSEIATTVLTLHFGSKTSAAPIGET